MDESKIGNKRNIQLSFFVFQFKLKYKKISNKEQEVNIYFCPPIELPKTIISLQRSPKYVHAACKQFKTIIAFDDVRIHHLNTSPPCPKYTHKHANWCKFV